MFNEEDDIVKQIEILKILSIVVLKVPQLTSAGHEP